AEERVAVVANHPELLGRDTGIVDRAEGLVTVAQALGFISDLRDQVRAAGAYEWVERIKGRYVARAVDALRVQARDVAGGIFGVQAQPVVEGGVARADARAPIPHRHDVRQPVEAEILVADEAAIGDLVSERERVV